MPVADQPVFSSSQSAHHCIISILVSMYAAWHIDAPRAVSINLCQVGFYSIAIPGFLIQHSAELMPEAMV